MTEMNIELAKEEAKEKAIKELIKVANRIIEYFTIIKTELNNDHSDDNVVVLGGLLIYISNYLADDETLHKNIVKNLEDKIKKHGITSRH